MITAKPFSRAQKIKRALFKGKPSLITAVDLNRHTEAGQDFTDLMGNIIGGAAYNFNPVFTLTKDVNNGVSSFDLAFSIANPAGGKLHLKGVQFDIPAFNFSVDATGNTMPLYHFWLLSTRATVTFAQDPVLSGISGDDFPGALPGADHEVYSAERVVMNLGGQPAFNPGEEIVCLLLSTGYDVNPSGGVSCVLHKEVLDTNHLANYLNPRYGSFPYTHSIAGLFARTVSRFKSILPVAFKSTNGMVDMKAATVNGNREYDVNVQVLPLPDGTDFNALLKHGWYRLAGNCPNRPSHLFQQFWLVEVVATYDVIVQKTYEVNTTARTLAYVRTYSPYQVSGQFNGWTPWLRMDNFNAFQDSVRVITAPGQIAGINSYDHITAPGPYMIYSNGMPGSPGGGDTGMESLIVQNYASQYLTQHVIKGGLLRGISYTRASQNGVGWGPWYRNGGETNWETVGGTTMSWRVANDGWIELTGVVAVANGTGLSVAALPLAARPQAEIMGLATVVQFASAGIGMRALHILADGYLSIGGGFQAADVVVNGIRFKP